MDKKLIYTLGGIVLAALIIIGIVLSVRTEDEVIEDVASTTPTEPTPQPMSRSVGTSRGTLTLSYSATSSEVVLSGELARPTPCVDYQVAITTSTSTNEIIFRIADSQKGNICVQVLGEPQQIRSVARASASTRYVVYFEGEAVFSGKLASASGRSAPGQLAALYDEPVRFIPQAGVSAKYLVDHRSAFDGKVIKVQGTVFGWQNGRVILGSVENRKRIEGYSVIIITAANESVRGYPIGEYVEVTGKVVVEGENVYVYKQKPARSKVVRTHPKPPFSRAPGQFLSSSR